MFHPKVILKTLKPDEVETYEELWVKRYLSRDGDVNVDVRGRPSNMAKTGTWRSAPFIYCMICADALVFFGLVGNLNFFYTNTLNFSPARAATNSSNFAGTAFTITVAWAFFADSFAGRFWTTTAGATISLIGAIIMAITVTEHHLLPPHCRPSIGSAPCQSAGDNFLRPFNVGLYLFAVGSGGVKACTAVFGADQFDKSIPYETKDEPRYFNFLFLFLQIGSLLAVTLITYFLTILGNGAGFGAMAGVILLGLVAFWFGLLVYRHKLPSGSSFTRLGQVIVATFKNRNLPPPTDASEMYEVVNYKGSAIRGSRKIQHSRHLRIFDKAAIVRPQVLQREPSPWDICTISQVEEFKRIILMLPIWLTSCVIYIVYAQFTTFSVQQASTLERRIGKIHLAASSISAFAVLAIIICVPIYDWLFVPFVRRITRYPQGLTTLQRIGIGICFAILAMVTAALVEHKRVRTAIKDLNGQLPGPNYIIPMSAFWLLPQYFLITLTELFTTVGQLEFFYNEAPDSMRNIAISYYFTSLGIGNFLSTVVVTMVNHITEHNQKGSWLRNPYLQQGGLMRFYYLLAIIVGVDLLVYLLVAHLYEYKGKDATSSIDSQSSTSSFETQLPQFYNKPGMISVLPTLKVISNEEGKESKEAELENKESSEKQEVQKHNEDPMAAALYEIQLPDYDWGSIEDEDQQPSSHLVPEGLHDEARFKLQLFRKSVRSPPNEPVDLINMA